MSVSTTWITVGDPEIPFEGIFDGSGLALDASGAPSAGTLDAITIRQNGETQGGLSDLGWSFAALAKAREQALGQADFLPLVALINASDPIEVDATTAGGGFDFTRASDGHLHLPAA